jgi:DNA polymerase-3 subunit epsilon/CBS domain-containing protein
MKHSAGATPLFALAAIAIDTETTGLDPVNARVIEIGAIRLSAGALVEADTFSKIVNPGVPVPQQSREIHGIPASETSAGPPISRIWAEFLAFAGNRVWIGHSTGFDLAMLGAEAGRYRLPFPAPRALDIRLLAAVALPATVDRSLDGLCAHFGVANRQRHRALGDARATAEVFLKLLPALEAAGVRTLAEAERASIRFAGEIRGQGEAGWNLDMNRPRSRGDAMTRIDTYSYRHRIGEVMSSPVATIDAHATLKDAIDDMVRRSVSSLFVAPPPGGGDWGILTERDAMRKIAAAGAGAFAMLAGDIASRPVRTIRANAFVYRAIGRMRRMKFRHLGVVDDAGKLIGVVSARDLLRLRAALAVALDDAIEEAGNARQLSVAWAGLPAVVKSLVDEGIEGHIVCRIVSEEIRAMTRRAATLAAEAMWSAGLGAPPCAYSLLVLGSAGRGESLLVPDQDNAIVFAKGKPGGDQDCWFAAFAERMSGILDEAGIPLCKGGVMAKNPQWRGDAETWRARLAGWIEKSSGADLLNVDIFFDAMPVAGDLELGHRLFADAYAAGHSRIEFAKLLGESIPAPRRPFSIFGALKGPNNRLDLKMHALFPIAAMARALAIRHNVAERSTRARLEGLAALGIGGDADLAALADAHATALSILLGSQGAAVNAGRKASNEIDLGQIAADDARRLKQALRDVESIPDLTRDLMFATPAARPAFKP